MSQHGTSFSDNNKHKMFADPFDLLLASSVETSDTATASANSNLVVVSNRLFFNKGPCLSSRLGKLRAIRVDMSLRYANALHNYLDVNLVDPGVALSIDKSLFSLEDQLNAVEASVLNLVTVRLVKSGRGFPTRGSVDMSVKMRVVGLSYHGKGVRLALCSETRHQGPKKCISKRPAVERKQPHRWQRSAADMFCSNRPV
jgi:hypothetical protein